MATQRTAVVIIFFLLVFVFSLPFWLLGAGNPVQLLPGLPLSALGAFAPALAALFLTVQSDRLPGAGQLLRRSFDYPRLKSKSWLLAMLIISPALAVVAYFVIEALGQPLPDPAPLTFAVLPLAVFFFIGALGEEIGWSGYATEPLQKRWGTLTAGVVLGAIWAVWHFVPLAQAHRSVEWIAWWSLNTVAFRMIMTWLYVRGGKSVFGAAVFHTMINLSWQLFPENGSFYDPRIFGLLTIGLAILIFATDHFRATNLSANGR